MRKPGARAISNPISESITNRFAPTRWIASRISCKASSTDKYEGFVNEWESISDTLIVENEKYGELSRLVVGDLDSLKVRWGIGFDERDRVRIDLTAAQYQLSQAVVDGGSQRFGTEFDATLRWQYTYNAQIRLFAGILKPGQALSDSQDKAGAGNTPPMQAGGDLIWVGGANLNVSF